MARCRLHTGYGEFETVEHYMKLIVGLADEIGSDEARLFGLTHLANALASMTRFDESLTQAERALAEAERVGHLKWQAELLTFALPQSRMALGDFPRAVADLDRGLEIANRIGDLGSVAFGSSIKCKLALASGALEDALAYARRTQATTEAIGMPYFVAFGQCVLGTCYLEIGGALTAEAVAWHERALATMEQPTGKILGAWLWAEIGHCALRTGKLESARQLFALALGEKSMPMYVMRPVALEGLCRLALAEDRLEEAERQLAEAAAYVERHRMHHLGPTLALLRADVDAAAGRHEQVVAHLAALEPNVAPMRYLALRAGAARIRSLRALGREAEAARLVEAGRATMVAILDGVVDDRVRAAFTEHAVTILGA
jgi:tetratricopeptide (TPR) repeat protein